MPEMDGVFDVDGDPEAVVMAGGTLPFVPNCRWLDPFGW